MLRPNANRDKTRGDVLQPGKPTNEAQEERRPKRLTAGLQRHADDVVLNDNLHGLRHLHREFAPAPHRIEFPFGRTTACELFGEKIGGCDRILDREVDADTADR